MAFPTWVPRAGDRLGSIAPVKLPISAKLAADLTAWAADYDDAVGSRSDWSDRELPGIEGIEERGLALWGRLVAEIGATYEVHYDSPLHGESYRVHRPPPMRH